MTYTPKLIESIDRVDRWGRKSSRVECAFASWSSRSSRIDRCYRLPRRTIELLQDRIIPKCTVCPKSSIGSGCRKTLVSFCAFPWPVSCCVVELKSVSWCINAGGERIVRSVRKQACFPSPCWCSMIVDRHWRHISLIDLFWSKITRNWNCAQYPICADADWLGIGLICASERFISPTNSV